MSRTGDQRCTHLVITATVRSPVEIVYFYQSILLLSSLDILLCLIFVFLLPKREKLLLLLR